MALVFLLTGSVVELRKPPGNRISETALGPEVFDQADANSPCRLFLHLFVGLLAGDAGYGLFPGVQDRLQAGSCISTKPKQPEPVEGGFRLH